MMESATAGTRGTPRSNGTERDPVSASPVASVPIETPIGLLLVRTSARGVIAIEFDARPGEPKPCDNDNARRGLEQATRELHEYFVGTRREFEVDVDAAGTPFRRRVWRELRTLDFGATISYGELARRVGNPNASRAVGAANGANPIPIIVPCHRVIGADATLTGFGGGMWRKEWLLRHEGSLDPLWS